MNSPAPKILGSLGNLSWSAKLVIVLATLVVCMGAWILSTKMVNKFNSSMGVTQGQAR